MLKNPRSASRGGRKVPSQPISSYIENRPLVSSESTSSLPSSPQPTQQIIDAFQKLLEYCKEESENFNPTFQKPDLHKLKRFFDKARGIAQYVLGEKIMRHLIELNDAKNSGIFNLWCYKLANFVKDRLLYKNKIKRELVENIGTDKIDIVRSSSPSFGCCRSEVEESLCQAMLLLSTQFIIDKEIGNSQDLQDIFSLVGNVKYTKKDLEGMSTQIFLDNLMLDMQNAEHLKYWDEQTRHCIHGKGGKPIAVNGHRYRVPTRIAKMMKVGRENYYHYNLAVDNITKLQTTFLFKNPLSKLTRSKATQEFYKAKCLEKHVVSKIK